jgi:hypothetical protein
MDNKLLVIYVGVQGVRLEDIEHFVKSITNRISPSTLKAEIIVIPTQSPETRVECIDPKYITDADLIKEHTEMMKTLQEQLQYQSEQLNEENNG